MIGAHFSLTITLARPVRRNRSIRERSAIVRKRPRGMYVHPTYAVTPEREPLGVLDAWMWAREIKDAQGHRAGPLESTRWIEGYERVAELAQSMPETRLVYMADREADIVALMAHARQRSGPPGRLVDPLLPQPRPARRLQAVGQRHYWRAPG